MPPTANRLPDTWQHPAARGWRAVRRLRLRLRVYGFVCGALIGTLFSLDVPRQSPNSTHGRDISRRVAIFLKPHGARP